MKDLLNVTSMSFKREVDGYSQWMFMQFAALCSMYAVYRKVDIPSVVDLNFDIGVGIVREGVVVPDPDRHYFEFDGGNVFSLNLQSLSEEQKENVYKMITSSVINGNLAPRQALPTYYHNLILAEAIKGNRSSTVVRYLELCKGSE